MAAKQVVVCERHAPSRSWPARTTTQRLIDSRRQVRFASTSAATLHHGKVAFDQAQSSFRRSFKQAIFCALCVWRSACSHTRKAAISRKMVIRFFVSAQMLGVVHETFSSSRCPCDRVVTRTSGICESCNAEERMHKRPHAHCGPPTRRSQVTSSVHEQSQ